MQQIGVYILQCSNGRYYIGSSNDLKRRLVEHKQGSVRTTRNVLPLNLKLFQSCESLKEARRLELRLKRFKNKSIIEQIIQDGFIKLKSST